MERRKEKKKEANPGIILTAMQDGKACFKQPAICVCVCVWDTPYLFQRHHEASS